jgi:hypothetical protein
MELVSAGTYSVTEDGLTLVIGLGWDDLSIGCAHTPFAATVNVTGPNSGSSSSGTMIGRRLFVDSRNHVAAGGQLAELRRKILAVPGALSGAASRRFSTLPAC